MTPAARLQAAAEILDEVIASARNDGPAADTIVSRYFKTRRYAGSKDRRAVRELVFRAIRRSGDLPPNGRAAIVGLASDDSELSGLFGQPRGPEPLSGTETPADRSLVPEWLQPQLSPLVSAAELTALLERAPLDLRANVTRTSREELAGRSTAPSRRRLAHGGCAFLPTAGSTIILPMPRACLRCRTRAVS